MTNPIPSAYYTTVSRGQVQLRSSARSGVIQTFGSNIATAIVQGCHIHLPNSKQLRYTQENILEVITWMNISG
jgi:hypothetical protein